jgi:hypothetical protein
MLAQSWLSVPPAPAWISIAVVAVGLAGKQRLDLHAAGGLQQVLQGLLGIEHDGRVVLGLAQLDQPDIVPDAGLERPDGLDLRIKLVPLAHDLPRLSGIIPEVGRFGAVVQVLEAGFGCIPVKDASSAGRPPARSHRRSSGLPRALFRSGYGIARVAEQDRRINPSRARRPLTLGAAGQRGWLTGG